MSPNTVPPFSSVRTLAARTPAWRCAERHHPTLSPGCKVVEIVVIGVQDYRPRPAEDDPATQPLACADLHTAEKLLKMVRPDVGDHPDGRSGDFTQSGRFAPVDQPPFRSPRAWMAWGQLKQGLRHADSIVLDYPFERLPSLRDHIPPFSLVVVLLLPVMAITGIGKRLR